MNSVLRTHLEQAGLDPFEAVHLIRELTLLPEFKQLNDDTKIHVVTDRVVLKDIYESGLVGEYYEWVTYKEPINSWDWTGLKATLWRIWKAIFKNAPEKGYQYYRKRVKRYQTIPPRRKKIELKPYGFSLSHMTYLHCAYDGEDDIFYLYYDVRIERGYFDERYYRYNPR